MRSREQEGKILEERKGEKKENKEEEREREGSRKKNREEERERKKVQVGGKKVIKWV